jgi:protein TonB
MNGPRSAGAVAAIAMHTLAVAALLAYAPARNALLAAAPIMVELIQPPRIEPPRPEPPAQLPKPLPVAKRAPPPPAPLPVLTASAEAPSPALAPPPAPVLTLPEPAPVAVAKPEPAPAVAPMTPPVFDADYLLNPAPVYPRLARRMGEQGRVILRVLVNAGGSADEVQLRTSSGHARLDDAARETVRAWKFVPAKRGGQAVPAWVLIPISFRIEG